ncbi:hypothetical protein ACFVS2_25205 [Brevibacillus sp. NPDC058079]|uniref:hypothetical protein n=1 Tax=Brevibacillus sp. NPDC058079 TaxID=3346330 RepID=UPI0036F17891
MFEYLLWMDDGTMNGWNRKSILASTPGKAKYDYFQDLKETWSELEFKDFVKKIKCKKMGKANARCLFTNKEEFERMCKYRNIPFAYQGMKVEVDGRMGTIVGNYGMNLLVWFEEYTRGQNCHPWWKTIYYDEKGSVIKDYCEGKIG